MSESERTSLAAGAPGPGVTADDGPNPLQEARSAPRKLVAGRIKLATDAGFRQDGRMLDLSTSGLSATMEDPIRTGVLCLLDCEISHHGNAYAISLIARTVECILVRGKGYRIGFHFQKVSDGSVSVIRRLLN